jgi:hypothetical protein
MLVLLSFLNNTMSLVSGVSVQVSVTWFKGSTFKGLDWLLAACFLLRADPETNSQEPVTRSQGQEPTPETQHLKPTYS